MDSINHFSHGEHPLILVADDEGRKDINSSGHHLLCNGCHEPVIINYNNTTSGGYYRCVGGCEFTLHKRCAELPPQIDFPHHPNHPLVLQSFPPSSYTNCYCDVCGRGGWKWFTYCCRPCKYDVDAVCALAHLDVQELRVQTKEMRVWENSQIHPHPLNLHLKPAKFFCDICLTEDVKDFPFICTDLDCSFSIHKRCAHAPPTLHLIHHHPEHPLRLSRSLPEMYSSFDYYCEFCKQWMVRGLWIYYCANCRFFSHLKCAFNALHQPPSGGAIGDQDGEDVEEEVVDPNNPFMNLPFPDSYACSDLLSLCLKDNTDGEASIQHHWAHPAHPLTLVIDQSSTTNIIIGDDPITVCDGCVRPITVPYYSCDRCNFYLHKHCANLPLTLNKHPLHPAHPLLLKCFPKATSYKRCKGCLHHCNKFLYHCDACEFYFDVHCAFLPQRIKHEKHKHPLLQCLVSRQISDASGFRFIFDGIAFRCDKANCSFLVSLTNAMLPRSIWHRYDKEHPILLTYPPVKDHPHEFFCELCETEIYPKGWMYHCGPCAFSFHTHCLYRRDRYLNVKWGSFGCTSDKHRHPLSYTRRKKNSKKFLCSLCNLDINGRLILECNPCKFQICVDCRQ